METKQYMQIKKKPSKHAGRWTKKQQQQFLKGLKHFGKDWSKIKLLIPSRSLTQIRSHAQKYFLRIQNKKYNSQDEYSQGESDSELILSTNHINDDHDKSVDVTEAHGFQTYINVFGSPNLRNRQNTYREKYNQFFEPKASKDINIQGDKNQQINQQQSNIQKVGFIPYSSDTQIKSNSFFQQLWNNYYQAMQQGQFLQLVDLPTQHYATSN